MLGEFNFILRLILKNRIGLESCSEADFKKALWLRPNTRAQSVSGCWYTNQIESRQAKSSRFYSSLFESSLVDSSLVESSLVESSRV
jgi:hypothetical protein